jgi:hypothetical protein
MPPVKAGRPAILMSGGQFWTPISPQAGSRLHADPHSWPTPTLCPTSSVIRLQQTRAATTVSFDDIVERFVDLRYPKATAQKIADNVMREMAAALPALPCPTRGRVAGAAGLVQHCSGQGRGRAQWWWSPRRDGLGDTAGRSVAEVSTGQTRARRISSARRSPAPAAFTTAFSAA